jgi:hypothetical protein
MAALRALLLVVTAFGVAGMHTIGHADGGHRHPFGGPTRHASAHVTHDRATVRTDPHEVAPPAAVVELHAVVPSAVLVAGLASPRPGGGLDPTAMCLAVLTLALLTAFAAAAAWATRGRFGPAVPAGAARLGAGRGPPSRASVGLLMADLSVLRT